MKQKKMPEKFGDKIQNVFKTIYDAADLKCKLSPLKRQIFSPSSGSCSGSSFSDVAPGKSPTKSFIGCSGKNESKVRFENLPEELPLKRKLQLEEEEQQQQQKRQHDKECKLRSISSPHLTDDISERKLRELKRERNALREQVSTLANFNYAREPEFVRDRLKLREISQEVQRMIRHLNSRHLEPVVSKVAGIEDQFAKLARGFEEESELLAKEFLEADGTHSESAVDKFINEYVAVRKEASKKRILADRIARERDSLSNLTTRFLG